MPTRHYSLYQGEPEVITVYWSQLFSRITVDYKGENILTANGWRLLFGVGKNVRLPSGEEINVHTVGLAPRITINDRPLPESPKSIRGKVHSNIILLYFAAGLSILLGILSFFFGETTFCGQDASGPLVISGLTLLGLTYWASKALSIVPYIVIIILITAIGGVAIFYYSSNEYWVEVIGATIILYIYLLYQLLQTASLVLQLRFKREGEARHQTEKRRMLVPTIHCSFHENEPDIISITWGRIHVTVKYKDTIVSVLNHGTILNGPQEVLLPNGEFITLSRQFMGILRVHKDGLLLPGSPGSTRFRVQQVGKLFYYFPGLFCLFGIIQLFLPPPFHFEFRRLLVMDRSSNFHAASQPLGCYNP